MKLTDVSILDLILFQMPPPPPPGPPPPPAPSKGGKAPAKKLGGAGADRGALLSSIQQGKALKKTVTNDRSAPLVGGGVKTANNTQGSSNQNGGPKFPPGGGAPRLGMNRTESNDINETPRLPGIGGLFAGGMPQLKPAGSRGINTGRVRGNFVHKLNHIFNIAFIICHGFSKNDYLIIM